MKRWEELVINASRAIVFFGLLSAWSYGKSDQVVAAATGLVSLFVPTLVRKLYPHPSRKAWPWVSPFYNDGVYTLFAVFMAAHVTFLNVPVLHIDLYNQVWGGADIPSHLLGGLVTWVIFNEVVLESSRTYNLGWSARKIIGISLFALLLVGVAWEFFEVALQPAMPWLKESLWNKSRDVIMEILGFALGILLVLRAEYPYSMTKPLEGAPIPGNPSAVGLLPRPEGVKK